MIRAALILLCLAASASAQVRLGFKITPEVALQYEKVTAEITIQNNAGQTLDSSSNGNCRVFYSVRKRDGSYVKETPDQPPLALLVPPARTLTFADTFTRRHDVGPQGAYTIQVRVEWGDVVFSSESRYLDVVPGTEVDRLAAQTPMGDRQFSLRMLNRDRNDRLFLRVDDDRYCYGVVDLGRFVRLGKPEMRVDAQGLLHVLHPSGPHQYAYSVFTPDGQRIRQESYGDTTSRAAMTTGPDGQVRVDLSTVQTQNEIKPLEAMPFDRKSR